MKSSSFDEAAVEAGLVLPRGVFDRRHTLECTLLKKEHDRGCQRQDATVPFGRIRQVGGSAPRKALDQEPAGPSSAGPLGNQETSTTSPKLGLRRQARPYPRSRRSPKLRLGGRPWKPPSEAKAGGGVIRESSGSEGARISMSVAEAEETNLPC